MSELEPKCPECGGPKPYIDSKKCDFCIDREEEQRAANEFPSKEEMDELCTDEEVEYQE